MRKIYLTACIGLDHDIVLLDQFSTHYKPLGIKPENFLLVLNTSEQNNISNKLKTCLTPAQELFRAVPAVLSFFFHVFNPSDEERFNQVALNSEHQHGGE